MMLEHSAFVPVPPAVAWKILEDIASWPRWTPTIRTARELDGPGLVPGHRFALCQPLQPETVWRITFVETGRAFRWRTDRRTGFEAGHRVEPAEGGCFVLADLQPTGGTLRAAWPLLRPILRRALIAETRGLARACLAHRSRSERGSS